MDVLFCKVGCCELVTVSYDSPAALVSLPLLESSFLSFSLLFLFLFQIKIVPKEM